MAGNGAALREIHYQCPIFGFRRWNWFSVTSQWTCFPQRSVRNMTCLCDEESNPAYTRLGLEDGEDGESRRDKASSTRRSAAVFSYLVLSVASLMVSFYLGQRLARNQHQRSHLQSDLIWGEGKSPNCWHWSCFICFLRDLVLTFQN
jgi:hypothetical protein